MRSEESWLLSVSFSSTSSQSTWNSFIPLFSQGIQKRALLYNLGNKSIACEGYVVLYFVHCQFNQIKFPMLVLFFLLIIPSVQFSCSVVFLSLQPCGLQHVRLPCPSPTPRACSNSCPSSWWCNPAISSSVVPFSFHLQSFPASGSFPMSQFFASRWPKY